MDQTKPVNLMNKWLALCSLCIFTSCFTGSLKDYYYPLEIEDEVAVYEYVNIDNPNYSEYWKVITDPSAETLITESYHADFELYNTFYEVFEDDGAMLTSYIDYEEAKDGTIKEIKGTPTTDNVFRWDNAKSYDFSVDYVNKYGRFEFTKRRTNLGFVNITVNGEEHKVIKFFDEYLVNALDQNDKYSFTQVSYYAKGIGMIKYERHIPNADPLVLELDGILSESEFNQKRAEAIRKKKEEERKKSRNKG